MGDEPFRSGVMDADENASHRYGKNDYRVPTTAGVFQPASPILEVSTNQMPASYESRQQVLIIKDTITSNFTAENWQELGVLTGGSDIINGHARLLRSLRFGDLDYAGCALEVLMLIVNQDDRNILDIKTYLHDKFQYGGVSVSSAAAAGPKIYFTPAVFAVPQALPDPNLISVMMPFDRAFSDVYGSIREVAVHHGMTCNRADDIWESSTVIQDVFGLIFRSYIVVCDFTGRNPNVFYEAGIAHTLGKHVVPITQNPDDIPFDLRHHRYVRYLNNTEGRLDLQTALDTRFAFLMSNRQAAS